MSTCKYFFLKVECGCICEHLFPVTMLSVVVGGVSPWTVVMNGSDACGEIECFSFFTQTFLCVGGGGGG